MHPWDLQTTAGKSVTKQTKRYIPFDSRAYCRPSTMPDYFFYIYFRLKIEVIEENGTIVYLVGFSVSIRWFCVLDVDRFYVYNGL